MSKNNNAFYFTYILFKAQKSYIKNSEEYNSEIVLVKIVIISTLKLISLSIFNIIAILQ